MHTPILYSYETSAHSSYGCALISLSRLLASSALQPVEFKKNTGGREQRKERGEDENVLSLTASRHMSLSQGRAESIFLSPRVNSSTTATGVVSCGLVTTTTDM
jgi:hypothetical protein